MFYIDVKQPKEFSFVFYTMIFHFYSKRVFTKKQKKKKKNKKYQKFVCNLYDKKSMV